MSQQQRVVGFSGLWAGGRPSYMCNLPAKHSSVCSSPTDTDDWHSAEQPGSRRSRRVDKRLCSSVQYALSLKQTRGKTNSV